MVLGVHSASLRDETLLNSWPNSKPVLQQTSATSGRYSHREPKFLAALLTPRGRGAVATVQIVAEQESLDRLPFSAVNTKPLSLQPLNRIVFGRWGDVVGEDVVVCRQAKDVVEVHCHGGDVAVDRILGDLESSGCRIVGWQELARCRTSVLAAELDEAVSNALTLKAADFLLAQRNGCFAEALASIETQLTDSDDHVAIVEELDAMLAWSDFGNHLTEPWKVVLAGRPNVGKSSLINALVGYARAIVSEVPGTTRDLVTAETAFDGWPVRLIDTAGQRESNDSIESIGIELARRELEAADCAAILLDVSQPIDAFDRELMNAAPAPDCIVVAHKCDLAVHPAAEIPGNAIRVSSIDSIGIRDLTNSIVNRLVPRTPSIDTALPVTARQTRCLLAIRDAVADGRIGVARQVLADLRG